MDVDTDWIGYTVPPSDLPLGFDCLASFIAKHRPGVLDHLLVPPEKAFEEDEEELFRLSNEFGLPVHYVRASAAYRRAGYERQPAFQTGLLVGMVGTDFSLEGSFFVRRGPPIDSRPSAADALC